MFRALLVSFFMLPQLLSGHATIPLMSSSAAPSQAAPQAGQSAPPAALSVPPQERAVTTPNALEQAMALAVANSPSLKAARTQIQQNQAKEITANLRPNP